MESSSVTLIKFLFVVCILQTNIFILEVQAFHQHVPSRIETMNNVEDFITLNFRQYDAQIADWEDEIEDFREASLNQLKPLNAQKTLLEDKIDEFEDKLNPLEMLSDLTKHCVQKFHYNLTSVTTMRTSMDNCITSGKAQINGFASSLEGTRNSLKYYLNNVKGELEKCKRNNNNSFQNYTLCVTNEIGKANEQVSSRRKTFLKEILSYRCSTDHRVQTTVECTFAIAFDAISNLGQLNRLIDDCIQGISLCPRCDAPRRCRDRVYAKYDSSFYHDENIKNPFYRINTTSDCFELHFAQPAFADLLKN